MWTVTTAMFDISKHTNTAAARGKFETLSYTLVEFITSFLATVPLIFIYYFFYDFAYTTMLISYTLEILPYNIRAKGLAIMVSPFVCHISEPCNVLYLQNISLYVNNALNSFVNAWALNAIGWKYVSHLMRSWY